jgi:hypothetical protein
VSSLHPIDVHYRFNGEPRQHGFDLPEGELSTHKLLMHLLQLHFGDAENSLLMPAADATPAQIVEQAVALGIVLEPMAGD